MTPKNETPEHPAYSMLLRTEALRVPARSAATAAGECRTAQGAPCELCLASRIEYEHEYALKTDALRQFWQREGLPGAPEPIVRAPKPRHYRTVTKRKVFFRKPKYTLGLLGLDESRANTYGIEVGACQIEPEGHAEIYRAVSSYIARPEHRDLAGLLTYLIIKGGAREFTVIVNASRYAPHDRQMFTAFSKYLTKHVPSIAAVFVFIDPERSKYYLSGNAQMKTKRQMVLHKLFGKPDIAHTVGERKFFYSPLSFSQTNHQILELFTKKAGEALELTREDHLYDLYCGYGLFSLCLAGSVRGITGVELSRESIEDAKANAARLHVQHARYLASDISEETLPRFIRHEGESLKVLLDPPRSGTKPGVIDALASYRPARVCHIVCNIDLLKSELTRWQSAGYRLRAAIPFDMFPGTEELEIMLSLEPAS